MVRGTTPRYILTVDGYDLTDKTVFVTIEQEGKKEITKTGRELIIMADETGSTVAFQLSQRDTLSLSAGRADVQIRFIDRNGEAWATRKAQLAITDILLEGEIHYENADDSD